MKFGSFVILDLLKIILVFRSTLSYSTIVLYSRVGKKSYGFVDFRTLKNGLAIRFTRKNHLECIGTVIMMLYLG